MLLNFIRVIFINNQGIKIIIAKSFNGCWFILTDPTASLAMLTDTEFCCPGYAVPSNGLMLTANGYMSFANGCTLRSNGLMLTSNGWANVSNVFKKSF